jgi:hypothetical protein
MPAESTSNLFKSPLFLAMPLNTASALGERQMFPKQTNNIFFFSIRCAYYFLSLFTSNVFFCTSLSIVVFTDKAG